MGMPDVRQAKIFWATGMGKTLVFLCLLVWLLINVPAALLGHWFPLDLPALYQFGNDLAQFLPQSLTPYNGSGRYFPVYWIFNELQVAFFNGNIVALFVVQSLVILISCLVLAGLVLCITGRWLLAALFFIAFYLASPLAENLSTLGKAEPLMVMLLSIILLISWKGVERGYLGVFGWLACASIMALSVWTKETSLVIVGFSLTGLVLTLALGRWTPSSSRRSAQWRPYADLTGSLSIGLLISRLPYFFFINERGEASYTTYNITWKTIAENIAFYIQQQPDVFLYFLSSVIMIAIYIIYSIRGGRVIGDIFDVKLIFVLSILASAIAYVLAIFVWRWSMAYYLLFPSALFRLCAAIGLFYLLSIGMKRTYLAWTSLLCVVTVFSVPYVYYVISSQISYSLIYTEAILKYASIKDEKSTLFLESYPFFAEQVSGTGTLLSELSGSEVQVRGIYDVLDPQGINQDFVELLGVSAEDIQRNRENLPIRGDYVLTFTGSKLATWFLRGVTPYFSEDSMLKSSSMYDMELLAENQISLPAAFIHVWNGAFTAETTSLGYKLYRVLESEPKFLWKGRYPDGWIGTDATLTINEEYAGPVEVTFSVPDFALPNRLRVTQDGVEIKVLTIVDTNERMLQFQRGGAAVTKLEFSLDRAVVPSEIDLARDNRPLAARLSLVKQ